MHYYQFNIGDYASHTRNLGLMEDLAFRRLLDEYYLHERPLNGCSTTVARQIGMLEQKDSVDFVLRKFFVLQDEEWRNKRVEEEIERFKNKAEQASRAGKASAEARVNGRSTDVQRTFNQPITINQEPITNNQEPIHIKQEPVTIKKQTPEKRKAPQAALSPPDDVVESVWVDFCQHRKTMRSPVTQTVLDGIRREAAKAGWSLEGALRETITRGWRSFKADWVMKEAAVSARNKDQVNKTEFMERLWRRKDDHGTGDDGRTIEAVTPKLG